VAEVVLTVTSAGALPGRGPVCLRIHPLGVMHTRAPRGDHRVV